MDEVIYLYAVCTVLLFVKMFGLSLYQGYHRIGKGAYKIPEDAAFVRRPALAEELPQVQRASRAWLNDLENIPIFLALGVAYILVEAPVSAASWLFPVFTAARILHSVFYLSSMQPWRTIAYMVGIICLFVMSYFIITSLP